MPAWCGIQMRPHQFELVADRASLDQLHTSAETQRIEDGDAPAIDYAVGIDLGTTNSVISVYRNGKLEVVLDKKGRNLTPSVVAYRDEDILVGYKALEQYADNPKNTITEVKRLMGRNYDKQVQEDAQHWPFTVINKDGEPRIQVEYRAETRQFRPEQVSSTILRKLFSLATQHLGVVVKSLDAVVTVPVYFGDSERNATVSACGIGGINVTRMITEPSAAALAYTLQTEESSPSRVLVFDMGGGTTDVSLLRVSEGHNLQVLACHGDNHLGGEDLDRLIVEQCLGHLYEKHRVRLTDKNLGPKTRLRLAVEKAKRELSGASQAHIKLQQIVTQVDFHYEITRKTFEALVASEFQKAVKLVEKCLEEAKMSPLDVSKVILAGGSTYIPRLQEMLSEVLPGVPLYSSVSQEVAVACGAALQAAKDLNIITQDFSLSEILPWSLSTDVEGGRSYVLLPKNTKIPAKAIKTFSTTQDFQKSIPIEIYEGESEFCKDNKLLGSMILTDIRPALKGLVKVRVGFSIDENGILQAAAKEKNSENKVSVKIERYKKEITEKQIECLKSTAEEEFDYGRVMELCRQMDKLKSVTKSDSSLPEMQRKCIKKQCDEMHAWAKSHPNPELGCFDGLLHDLRNKLKTLGLNVTLDDNGKMTFNDKDL